MTKQQQLDIIMLLSALESWGFVAQCNLPDYLHEQITASIKLLSKEILNENRS
jgi:hypothetical protein